jgi:hypothetical protein
MEREGGGKGERRGRWEGKRLGVGGGGRDPGDLYNYVRTSLSPCIIRFLY